jgi:ribonuclease HII
MRQCTAGVDEAGRGPLAGPVVAAAVILDPDRPIRGLADSKQLDPAVRDRLALEIRAAALATAVAWADPCEIDRLNILEATLLAMRRALLGLAVRPSQVIVDGNRLPRLTDLGIAAGAARAIVRGDATEAAISAASILAKTERDRMMISLATRYPGFGLDGHKGYPTPQHRAAVREHGVSAIHRLSFAPCREAL